MKPTPIIAVIGDARLPAGDPREVFAEDLGRRIVDAGWRLQTGGLGGVMEAASRGGRASERWSSGSILGILPGWDPAEANAYVDIALPTGLDHGRNAIVAQADAVVAIGGGAGTLSELAFAWMLHRFVIARRGEGWAGRLADAPLDDRVRYPDIPDDQVFGVDMAEEAIALIQTRLPSYGRRHNGVRRRHPR